MSAPQAVRVTTQEQYDTIIEVLKQQGFKPFQLGEKFRTCFITIENRYMQLANNSKMLTDKGYETISFEEFNNNVNDYRKIFINYKIKKNII